MRRWRVQRNPATARADPAQAELWRARHDRLTADLSDDPDHEWAWLWRTRIKVLAFLIEQQAHQTDPHARPPTARTDEKQHRPNPPSADSYPEQEALEPESTAPYDTDPTHEAPDPSPYLRDPSGQRSRLERLHDINRFRRAREPKIKRPPPPDLPAFVLKPVWRKVLQPVTPSLSRELSMLISAALPYRLQRLLRSEVELKKLSLKPCSDKLHFTWELTYERVPILQDAESRQRQHMIEEQTRFEQMLEDSAEALADMDGGGYKMFRQVIAFDLGFIELTDEVLDEETIRAILAEHGLDDKENE